MFQLSWLVFCWISLVKAQSYIVSRFHATPEFVEWTSESLYGSFFVICLLLAWWQRGLDESATERYGEDRQKLAECSEARETLNRKLEAAKTKQAREHKAREKVYLRRESEFQKEIADLQDTVDEQRRKLNEGFGPDAVSISEQQKKIEDLENQEREHSKALENYHTVQDNLQEINAELESRIIELEKLNTAANEKLKPLQDELEKTNSIAQETSRSMNDYMTQAGKWEELYLQQCTRADEAEEQLKSDDDEGLRQKINDANLKIEELKKDLEKAIAHREESNNKLGFETALWKPMLETIRDLIYGATGESAPDDDNIDKVDEMLEKLLEQHDKTLQAANDQLQATNAQLSQIEHSARENLNCIRQALNDLAGSHQTMTGEADIKAQDAVEIFAQMSNAFAQLYHLLTDKLRDCREHAIQEVKADLKGQHDFEIEIANGQCEAAQKVAEEHIETLKQWKSKIENLETQLKNTLSLEEYNKMVQERDQLRAQSNDQSSQNTIQALQDQLAQAQIHGTNLGSSNMVLQQEITNLKKQLASAIASDEINRMKSKMNQMEQELKSAVSTRDSLLEELELIQNLIDKEWSENLGWNKDNSSLKNLKVMLRSCIRLRNKMREHHIEAEAEHDNSSWFSRLWRLIEEYAEMESEQEKLRDLYETTLATLKEQGFTEEDLTVKKTKKKLVSIVEQWSKYLETQDSDKEDDEEDKPENVGDEGGNAGKGDGGDDDDEDDNGDKPESGGHDGGSGDDDGDTNMIDGDDRNNGNDATDDTGETGEDTNNKDPRDGGAGGDPALPSESKTSQPQDESQENQTPLSEKEDIEMQTASPESQSISTETDLNNNPSQEVKTIRSSRAGRRDPFGDSRSRWNARNPGALGQSDTDSQEDSSDPSYAPTKHTNTSSYGGVPEDRQGNSSTTHRTSVFAGPTQSPVIHPDWTPRAEPFGRNPNVILPPSFPPSFPPSPATNGGNVFTFGSGTNATTGFATSTSGPNPSPGTSNHPPNSNIGTPNTNSPFSALFSEAAQRVSSLINAGATPTQPAGLIRDDQPPYVPTPTRRSLADNVREGSIHLSPWHFSGGRRPELPERGNPDQQNDRRDPPVQGSGLGYIDQSISFDSNQVPESELPPSPPRDDQMIKIRKNRKKD